MVRQFIFTIILFCILVVFGQQASVAAEDKTAISNIGFVLYSKSLAPGTLNARWMLTDKHKGPALPPASAWKSRMAWRLVGAA